MRAVVQVRPSCKWTPERPLHVWHVFVCGRAVLFGIAQSEDEARAAAQAALREYRRERATRHLSWLLEAGDDDL
jgi:xanthine dehydrogenase molybdopterin-binding subunit B